MKHDENLLTLSAQEKQRIQSLLGGIKQDPGIISFSSEETSEIYIPVKDGEIRCLHHKPAQPAGVRPVLFIPGWGTNPEGFHDFFNAVNGRIECFYLETREKNSSRLNKSRARLDMDQQARDIQNALQHLGLAGTDFALIGTCWGSTMIAYGLARQIIEAPTVVLFDPMHTLWFPKWILKYIAPFTPDWFWNLIKPAARQIAIAGMKEVTQLARTKLFIDNATIWKWRRSALQCRDLELYDEAADIRQEVSIFNGVLDHVHDNSHYPRLAALIPKGRLFYLQVDESQREYLMGLAAVEFAKTPAEKCPPAVFQEFEKKIR